MGILEKGLGVLTDEGSRPQTGSTMKKRGTLGALLAGAILALAVPHGGRASMILLGLLDRGVHVQEFWQHARPFYLIASNLDATAVLTATPINPRAEEANSDAEPARVWTLAPHSTIVVPAVVPDQLEHIHFEIDGKNLGLLCRLDEPPAGSSLTLPVSVSSAQSLTSGRRQWMEQPAIFLPARQEIELRLSLEEDDVTIHFGAYADVIAFLNPGRELDPDDYEPALTPLVPISVRSETAHIRRRSGVVEVDLSAPAPESGVHEVWLVVWTPAVTTRTPFLLQAPIRGARSSSWFTRVLVVRPAE